MQSRALRLEIDVGAIRHNARAIMRAIGPQTRLYACLKGDAYGCGIRHVAPALQAAGVQQFAVGSVDDAIAIRQAGIHSEVLLYPNCLPEAIDAVETHRLTITLNSVEEATAWNNVASRVVPAFIKVDVGALRGGVMPQAAAELAAGLRDLRKLDVSGAYAHLHLPDPVGMKEYALHQKDVFVRAERALADAGLHLRTRMVSGTAALLQYPELDFNAVDPGRALFGIGFGDTVRRLPLRPAIRRWSTQLLLVKAVAPADVAPYTAPFPLTGPRRIGVVPLGWGDGLPRQLPAGAAVLVRGRRAPLLPPTHFEHIRVDLTDIDDARYGDEVVILGRQGEAELHLADVAQWCGKDSMHFQGTLPRHIERVPVDD